MFSLEGRTALVTGARAGIGRAIAVGLARAGADLILHGHHDDLDDTEREVKAHGRAVSRLVLDLSRTDEIAAAVAGLEADILVNNAGTIARGSTSLADWRRVLAVNLDAVYMLSQGLLERGATKVISIASLLSFQGGVNVTSYAAAKHAVAGLTKALSNEWAPRGAQVNAIAPGYIRTDVTRALQEDRVREREITARIPAGRWGAPEDLAGAAVFLASPASDYVTGHVLVVDGGWLAR
ncbi:SDR family oxidoreductase [Nonomuraea sediminis]|uniref:SDR family oxidoreductase n=1 Tax=Nonomuraea sediminis TaxID=2835864 RepID=UPI001BDBE202|nr:SDR family oxidoreductase [Nonomuraea sediminis]